MVASASDTAVSQRSGLLFRLNASGKPGRTVRRSWQQFCGTLTQSCRREDVTRWDGSCLALMFAGASASPPTAIRRVKKQAERAWRLAGRPDPLLRWVEVEEIGAPGKTGPDRLDLAPTGTMTTPRAQTARAGAEKVKSSITKRTIDIVGAVIAGILAAPLMVLIACGIRVSSEGPILFLQRRVGVNGELFTMFKFRTMENKADEQAHRAHMRALMSGVIRVGQERPIAKMAGDARIYPLGALLRRWSLDELPQLYNVLNGTMSLVGPRPSVHYELEDYKDWHRDRLSVKPGITGLWQVHGRGRTGFDDMVRMDLRYIGDWSILEDIKLLALTIPAALGRNGAQ